MAQGNDGPRAGITGLSKDSWAAKAERDGTGYRINGTKTFISNGPVADLVIVFALTDAQKGYHGGVTAFLVETKTAGFSASKKFEKMGLRTSPIGELMFTDLRKHHLFRHKRDATQHYCALAGTLTVRVVLEKIKQSANYYDRLFEAGGYGGVWCLTLHWHKRWSAEVKSATARPHLSRLGRLAVAHRSAAAITIRALLCGCCGHPMRRK